jgi:hypothetical protein
MNDSNREKMDSFIRSLKEALGGSAAQAEEILAEVRADLDAHLERYQAAGHPEDEAVELALGEMGNPYELAHHMRRELPPFGGKVLTTIRYVAASGVILWALLLLWMTRPGVYGFSPFLVAIILGLHLPVILLIWPRIVWRKNWLFGMVPAGLALLVAMFFNLAGTSESVEIRLDPGTGDGSAEQAPVEEYSGPESTKIVPTLMVVGLGATAIALLWSMQQRSQRRVAVLATLLAAVIVEVPYQIEERAFRQDWQRICDYRESSFRKNGAYPTQAVFKSEGPKLRGKHIWFHQAGEHVTLFWSRPLSSGFSINCSSENDRIWVQD